MKNRVSCIVEALVAVLFVAVCGRAESPFPTHGLMPKQETGVLKLLAEHPTWDGRGVVVAIFDTGIDPGAEGLQVSSTGKPKIIDMIDATGSGDVQMSQAVEPEDGKLEGRTGRTLKLAAAWLKPGRKFRLGLKAGYDFFPEELVARLKRERRQRFDRQQMVAEEALQTKIQRIESGDPGITPEERRQLPQLQLDLAQLKKAGKSFQDPGPVYDCVVFHDGSVFRAVIDTDQDGDLTDESVMADFRRHRQWDRFDGMQLNFAVNIYEEGRRLSIVVDSGAHGTHVAGIVAGNYPDQPELNGVAPGAQLVSVKIGDPRLGGMETASGILRGLRAVIDNRCDLVNMSFGEPTTRPNRAWLSELLTELVREHNVVFVSSAGNAGPALSTVGAPGGTTSAIIGAGAYVSPQMAKIEYAIRENLPDNAYTWSSRGPTYDGDWGVDVLAPGGAFSPVPQWTLHRNMQMNGTSMASPNTCGSIALMLSAAKARGIRYSPASVLRAVQNTAAPIARLTKCTQGPGLIQVDRAVEHLLAHAEAPGELLPFDVRLGSDRGIYLRELATTRHPSQHSVRVTPVFPERQGNEGKVDFQIRYELRSTQSWVQTAEHLLMASGGNRFRVEVDPTGLTPGLHTAEVWGLDADRPARGPLWRLPVTVVVPHHVPDFGAAPAALMEFADTCELESGSIARRYIALPAGAAWCRLQLRRQDQGQTQRIIVHAVQQIPDRPYRKSEMQRYLSIGPDGRWDSEFAVEGGRMLELCLGQYWSSAGSMTLNYRLEVHGLTQNQHAIQLSAAAPTARVEVGCPFGKTQLAPQASVASARWSVPVARSKLKLQDPIRDRMPDGRLLHSLTLEYDFEMEAAASITPRFPQLEDLLYDSPFAGHVWMLFDQGKRRLAVGDWRVDSVRLGPGKHTLRLYLLHTDAERLESWKQLPLVLERSLGRSVPVHAYSSLATAAAGDSPIRSYPLNAGRTTQLHFVMPKLNGLPSWLPPGAVLVGNVRLAASLAVPPLPLHIVVPSKGARPSPATSTKVADDLEQAIRDTRLAHLRQLGEKGDVDMFLSAAAALLKDFPDYLPALAAKLEFLDHESRRKHHLAEIVEAADEILKRIDQHELRVYLADPPKPTSAADKTKLKEMTERKKLLIDTLYRKGRALAYMELPDVVSEHPVDDEDAHNAAFEQNYAQLAKWVDVTGKDYYLLAVRRERRRGNYGKALELLNKHLTSLPPEERLYKKRRDLYESLGWTHLAGPESLWLQLRFPPEFEQF